MNRPIRILWAASTLPEAARATLESSVPDVELIDMSGAGEANVETAREGELRERVASVDVVVGGGEWLKGIDFTGLWFVQFTSAGVDRYIGSPLWNSAIELISANGVHAPNIGEHVLGSLLALAHRLPSYWTAQQQRCWAKEDGWRKRELRGKTMGILGYGAIGREIGRLASALGVDILAMNRSGSRTEYRDFTPDGTGDQFCEIPLEIYGPGDLPHMLPRVDYLVIVLPSTGKTKGLLGREQFRMLRPGTLLLNAGRGDILDERALVDAIREGVIAGAALDVFREEPLPDHSSLWELPNVLVTPHIAGHSPHYWERLAELVGLNLRRLRAGEPLLNQVNRKTEY